MSMRLGDGDRVCIVGGGPAGSFAALHLLQLAGQLSWHLEVLIFEPRDFSRSGPGGCNRCAGILSNRLLRGLEGLGLALPPAVVQSELHAYSLHLNDEVMQISHPEAGHRIVSIYRGGGPRLTRGEVPASFDGFLLEQAISRGARALRHRVHRVSWAEGRPLVHSPAGIFPADLLVLATGINSRSPLSPEFGYRPPPTAVMAQDEMLRPDTWPADQVGVFFRQPPGLTFGALIPKGRFLNISLLGHGFTRDTIEDFIELQALRQSVPYDAGTSLCGCTPRIAVGPARRYYGDRWVAVGDAAVTRLYKDGIGSAFVTAQAAMGCAIRHGVSRRAFRRGYAPTCRRLARDNLYGRLLFRLWHLTLRFPPLLRLWQQAIQAELAMPPPQRHLVRVLWGMFTGDELYRDLFWLSFSPTSWRMLHHGRRHARRRQVP